MAVFTAIGTAIAMSIGGALVAGGALTILGTVVAGVIAAGLAFGTAKLLGVFDVPDIGAGRANGSKVQVAPSTDNKIGIAYGRNFMSGPITDVAITNQNDTMNYCITLSEFVEGETYTMNQVFWGDRKLIFSGANVINFTDPNGTTREDWSNKIRIRLYAGNTSSSSQFFPTSGAVDATTMMAHWTNTTNYTMEGLVFAMIEVDYDAEEGLTGLGAMTFDVTNSMHNPGEVLFDYMTNSRYGAGLSNSDIDITSILGTANTQMKGYCDEQISFTNKANVSSTIDRFQINGYLSTFDSCMDNIDKICRNSSTYFTFDGKQGKFKAVPNRPYSTAELANAFVLNDDNIVSKISLSSTELYQQLNKVTVEFADQNRKDQTNTVVVETPSGDRNTGEPDNNLDYRAELVNNNIHAEQLGNIDLNQSRKGMVVELTSDFSGLQIDAGDVVKVNNSDYGFTDKLFRVMKNTEALSQEGMILCNLLLLEYDASVYVDPAVTETADEDDAIDVPYTPPPVDIPPIGAFQHYFANVGQKSTTGSGSGARFDVIKDFVNRTYFLPAVSGLDPLANGGSGYNNGDNVTISGNVLAGIDGTHDMTFTIATTQQPVGRFVTANAVSGNSFVHPGFRFPFVPGDVMGNLAVGTQITETPTTNTSMTASGTFSNIAANIDVDLIDVDSGDYTIFTNFTPIGSLANISTANFGVGVQGDVTFANGNVINSFFDSRTRYDDQSDLPTVVNTANVFTVTDEMESVTLRPVGFNTSDQTAGTGQRGYTNMKVDMLKFRRGDKF